MASKHNVSTPAETHANTYNEHGWIEGEEEGSVDTYMRFRRMIDHYKTCPEVDHG